MRSVFARDMDSLACTEAQLRSDWIDVKSTEGLGTN